MAERIVVVGPNYNGTVPCLEIKYPGDAYLMIKDGIVRVAVSKHSGPLSNATVLTWPEELASARDTNKAADAWWDRVLKYTGTMVKTEPFELSREELA